MGSARFEIFNFLLVVLVVYLLPRPTDGSSCTSPAIEIYSNHGILCYWLLGDNATATNAKMLCESTNGFLAEIPDSTVLNTLVSSLPVNYPGLSFDEKLHLGYLLKTAVITEARSPPFNVPTYTPWATDEPTFNETFENCVAMNNSNGEWFAVSCSDVLKSLCFNITVPQCVFNTTELALFHMSVDSDTAEILTNVTFKCDEGHALFVNHTSQEAVTNMTCQCVFVSQENKTQCQPYGSFYNKRCDVVTCPMLTQVEHSFNNLVTDRNYTYGESVTFNCTAGYNFLIDTLQWPPQLTINCTDTGQWSVTPPAKCKKSRMYVGCYATGALQVISTVSLTSQLYCTNDCKSLDFRFAASANGSCICGNFIDQNVPSVHDMHCNMTCPLVISDAHFAYCGGESNEESIYQTISSYCYKDLNVTGIPTFAVTGNTELTCQQRCLAENVFYSIVWGNECACTNRSNIDGTAMASKCDNVQLYNGTLYAIETMYDLNPAYESCEELYEAGVKDNGYYNLKSLDRKYCNFKDGTICPLGWIGYNNDCYFFQKGNFTFADAVQYCQQLNATVASLLSSEQNAFAASTIKGFEDYQGSTTLSKKWFIGLFDPNSLTAYSWNDGNLLTEQQFAATEPIDENLNCVVLFEDDGLWYSHSCAEATNAICKLSRENIFCINDGSGLSDVIWNATLQDMTLTMCMQACLARNATFSLARKETCLCVGDLPTSSLTSFANCDSGCPANSQQMCGGTVSGYYTAANLTNATLATSCEDLQSQGLTGDMYKLNGLENATVCENTGCPYAWIKGNSSCYKLMLGKKHLTDASTYCANYSSHLLVIETEEKEAFISNIIGNLTFYSSAKQWSLGLKMTGSYTNRYFWANGQRGNPLIKNITDTELLKRGFFKSTNMEWNLGGSINERSYICEESEVYAGCFVRPNSSVTLIQSDNYMIVQLCVETCRGFGYDFALLLDKSCLCDKAIPIEKYDAACTEFCANVQPCGSMSNDAVSVYRTWLYPSYDTCTSLYDQGIIRSGMYLIDGVNTTCNFYDNTTCPTNEWIGYRNKCYMFIDVDLNQDELYTRCASLGGHLLTITDEAEHIFLRSVLKVNPKYTHIKIRIGLVDQFGLGITTWTTGALPSYFPRPSPSSSLTSVVMELTSTSDYGFIMNSKSEKTYSFCELQTQHMGCFIVPVTMNATITTYNNMELTQCKQICMGSTSLQGFALIQRSSCYCTETLQGLTPVNDSSCAVTCPGNSLQVCGGENVVNAYKLDSKDMVSSCSSLYRAGVWYHGVYLIENSTQTCGSNLFDNTECPESWYGRKGTCYKLASTLSGMEYVDAEKTCLQNGGYLFYPGTYDARLLFMEVLPYINNNTNVDGFWTSVKDELLTSYTRAGDGWMITNRTVVDENIYTVYNVTTGSLIKHSNGSFGVICEKSAGYVGCTKNNTNTPAAILPYARHDMSATQCIQYCLGWPDTAYSVVQNNECSCYNETTVFEASETACEQCPGYSAQPCGSSTALSVYKLSHYASNLASSCVQLFDLGVRMQGYFIIQPQDNDPISLSCFEEVYDGIVVPETSITASSFKSPHVPAASSFMQVVINSDSSWIPADSGDPNPWLQLDLPYDYLVRGMFTTGRPDAKNEQWSETLEVRYKSTVDSSWKSIGSFPGNTDRTSLVITMFPLPFVSKSVRLYPGGANIALMVSLLGSLMTDLYYMHGNSYLGCYTMFSSADIQQYPSVLSEMDCKTTCGNTVPMFSYNNMTLTCNCHAKLGGRLPLAQCNTTIPYLEEVHRLYEINCQPPDTVERSVNETTYVHVAGLFTVSSTVQFTCDPGYEFYLDNTTNRTITCGDDYLWQGVLGDSCRIISCPVIAFSNGTISTFNNTYSTEVSFTCDVGFRMMSGATEDTIKCQADKTWNSTIPVCQVIDCGTPLAVANTLLTDNVHTYGANVTYTCVENMRFAPDTYTQTSQCGLDGNWEPLALECTTYECSNPPTIGQATIVRINITTAIYTCFGHHFFPDGSAVKNITCNESFVWEDIPKCIYDDSLVTQKRASITFIDMKLRQTTSPSLAVVRSDSTIDCGDQCLRNSVCRAFNYNNAQTGANCILFSPMMGGNVFVAATDWSYFELYDVKYLP